MADECTPQNCTRCALKDWCDHQVVDTAANFKALTERFKSIHSEKFAIK